MRVVFIGLSAVFALFGVLDVADDIRAGAFSGGSVVWLVCMGLIAGVFAFLAWVFDGKDAEGNPVESQRAKARREKREAYRRYSPEMKRRIWKFRILGLMLMALAVWLCVAGNWRTVPVGIATVILIVGLAVFNMGAPEDYNAMAEGVGMIAMDRPRTIEEFGQAFKEVVTPLGSGWLGTFSTSPRESLIFGPGSGGVYLYFYLSGDGLVGYVGCSALEAAISGRITVPLYPPQEGAGQGLGEEPYESEILSLRDWLQESLEHYVKTGMPLPFRGL